MNLFSFIEKRKQTQIYTLFTFLSSSLSYFDFSSFELMENFQEFNILTTKKNLSSFSDILLGICFFSQKDNYFISKSLKKFFLKSTKLTSTKKGSISLFEKMYFSKHYKDYQKTFRHEMKDFYEEAITKSLEKYKTPIVTSEIFLLTAIPKNPVFFKNFLKFFIKNKKQWFMLKYKFIRHLYFENYSLKSSIRKNIYNYSYLLSKYSYKKRAKKTRKQKIKTNFFKKSLEVVKNIFGFKKQLVMPKKENESILRLRSLLFSSLLKSNFQQILEDDILLTTKEFSTRKYKVKLKNKQK